MGIFLMLVLMFFPAALSAFCFGWADTGGNVRLYLSLVGMLVGLATLPLIPLLMFS